MAIVVILRGDIDMMVNSTKKHFTIDESNEIYKDNQKIEQANP